MRKAAGGEPRIEEKGRAATMLVAVAGLAAPGQGPSAVAAGRSFIRHLLPSGGLVYERSNPSSRGHQQKLEEMDDPPPPQTHTS